MFGLSSKGFIPETCFPECVKEFSYLDKLLSQYHNQHYQSFDDFRRDVQEFNIHVEDVIITISKMSELQIQKIYSMTSILSHLYVWGGEKQETRIPASLAVPWYLASKELGIPPVITHAAVDLYNWKLKNKSLPFSLENIEPINYFNIDPEVQESEKWFYLPMIAIEGECGCILQKMDEIYQMLEKEEVTINFEVVTKNLKFIKQKLVRQYDILKTTERCDPEHFYHLIRPYLRGSKQKDFPGWYLEGIEMYIQYGGGSAAQSSLIQAEDIFLGISHPEDNFLRGMRDYMPKPHKLYLEHQENRPCLATFRTYVTEDEFQEIEMIRLECVEEIRQFRKFHYNIVQKYVCRFNNMTGTAGTDINKNLKEYIYNTEKSKIDSDRLGKDNNTSGICLITCQDILVICFWLCYLVLVYWYFTSSKIDKMLMEIMY